MAVVGEVDASILGGYFKDVQLTLTQLTTQLTTLQAAFTELENNLVPEVYSFPATVHPDGVNTDCNALTYGKHVVFSDGANATSPAPAGLYFIEAVFIADEAGQPAVGQRAWRFSTGLLYSRLFRAGVWSVWNKIG